MRAQQKAKPSDKVAEPAKDKADERVPDKGPATRRRWALFRRRQIPVPTWRGWLLLIVLAVLFCVIAVKRAYWFLAVTAPKPGGVLVIEGWAPDYALAQAAQEFRRNRYEKLFATGGPVEYGAPLSEYTTYAEVGAATLLKLGLGTNEVQAAPAPLVKQDRTYTAAVALRHWMREHNLIATNVNVLTVGPHARRTRLMFHKAFGKGVTIGIIATGPGDFEENKWWRSSQGFRAVTGELMAYGYARLLFHPAQEPPGQTQ